MAAMSRTSTHRKRHPRHRRVAAAKQHQDDIGRGTDIGIEGRPEDESGV